MCPMYEYRCDECEHEFTYVCSMDKRNDLLSDPCPECGTKEVFRLYSNAGHIDIGVLNADKNMERSGVQSALERIRDNHPDAKMKWKG